MIWLFFLGLDGVVALAQQAQIVANRPVLVGSAPLIEVNVPLLDFVGQLRNGPGDVVAHHHKHQPLLAGLPLPLSAKDLHGTEKVGGVQRFHAVFGLIAQMVGPPDVNANEDNANSSRVQSVTRHVFSFDVGQSPAGGRQEGVLDSQPGEEPLLEILTFAESFQLTPHALHGLRPVPHHQEGLAGPLVTEVVDSSIERLPPIGTGGFHL